MRDHLPSMFLDDSYFSLFFVAQTVAFCILNYLLSLLLFGIIAAEVVKIEFSFQQTAAFNRLSVWKIWSSVSSAVVKCDCKCEQCGRM